MALIKKIFSKNYPISTAETKGKMVEANPDSFSSTKFLQEWKNLKKWIWITIFASISLPFIVSVVLPNDWFFTKEWVSHLGQLNFQQADSYNILAWMLTPPITILAVLFPIMFGSTNGELEPIEFREAYVWSSKSNRIFESSILITVFLLTTLAMNWFIQTLNWPIKTSQQIYLSSFIQIFIGTSFIIFNLILLGRFFSISTLARSRKGEVEIYKYYISKVKLPKLFLEADILQNEMQKIENNSNESAQSQLSKQVDIIIKNSELTGAFERMLEALTHDLSTYLSESRSGKLQEQLDELRDFLKFLFEENYQKNKKSQAQIIKNLISAIVPHIVNFAEEIIDRFKINRQSKNFTSPILQLAYFPVHLIGSSGVTSLLQDQQAASKEILAIYYRIYLKILQNNELLAFLTDQESKNFREELDHIWRKVLLALNWASKGKNFTEFNAQSWGNIQGIWPFILEHLKFTTNMAFMSLKSSIDPEYQNIWFNDTIPNWYEDYLQPFLEERDFSLPQNHQFLTPKILSQNWENLAQQLGFYRDDESVNLKDILIQTIKNFYFDAVIVSIIVGLEEGAKKQIEISAERFLKLLPDTSRGILINSPNAILNSFIRVNIIEPGRRSEYSNLLMQLQPHDLPLGGRAMQVNLPDFKDINFIQNWAIMLLHSKMSEDQKENFIEKTKEKIDDLIALHKDNNDFQNTLFYSFEDLLKSLENLEFNTLYPQSKKAFLQEILKEDYNEQYDLWHGILKEISHSIQRPDFS